MSVEEYFNLYKKCVDIESIQFSLEDFKRFQKSKNIKIEKEKNEETFGVLQNVNPEIKNSNRSLEFIKSVITDNDWVNYGKLLIELENGQVWKQVDSSPYRGPKDLKGKPIIINSASLGSFLLKIDGVGGKYRVRREK